MHFSKWQALGNSYLLVEVPSLDAARAQRLCHPGLGIGADGVLQVVERDGTYAEIVIWNPDGSTAEMSGNGTRIAARWLAAETRANEVLIVSAGREVHARVRGAEVETDIGDVEVAATETIDVGGEPIEVTPVSLGNPHAVIEATSLLRERLLRLGPLVEVHPRFPERTNVQLARPRGTHDVEVLVWERGAGETAASGSSAVAVAAVAAARGWCATPVAVHMPGGVLRVDLVGERSATLTGPAERVCIGETDL